MKLVDKEERNSQRSRVFSKQKSIELPRSAILFLAKQIVLRRSSRDVVIRVSRGDPSTLLEVDQLAYNVASELDPSKLRHKQKNTIRHRMTTLGHFALWELMDIEQTLLGTSSTAVGVSDNGK